MVQAQVSNKVVEQINEIVRRENLTKGNFLGMLIEMGLKNLSFICEECAKRKHDFPEMELLKIRVTMLEEKLKDKGV